MKSFIANCNTLSPPLTDIKVIPHLLHANTHTHTHTPV